MVDSKLVQRATEIQARILPKNFLPTMNNNIQGDGKGDMVVQPTQPIQPAQVKGFFNRAAKGQTINHNPNPRQAVLGSVAQTLQQVVNAAYAGSSIGPMQAPDKDTEISLMFDSKAPKQDWLKTTVKLSDGSLSQVTYTSIKLGNVFGNEWTGPMGKTALDGNILFADTPPKPSPRKFDSRGQRIN